LIGWTLDKPKGFLVHLPSRDDSLCDNLVKSCFRGLDGNKISTISQASMAALSTSVLQHLWVYLSLVTSDGLITTKPTFPWH